MANQEAYVPRPHLVVPHKVIPINALGGFDIKLYTLIPEGTPDFTRDELNGIGFSLAAELLNNRIKKRLGLGFGIMSDGIFNVGVWGGQYPSLLNQTVYSFDRKDLADIKDPAQVLKKQSLDETGTFCCWELAIVGHEGAAWRHYLLSPQSSADRQAYLDNRFGLVGR